MTIDYEFLISKNQVLPPTCIYLPRKLYIYNSSIDSTKLWKSNESYSYNILFDKMYFSAIHICLR